MSIKYNDYQFNLQCYRHYLGSSTSTIINHSPIINIDTVPSTNNYLKKIAADMPNRSVVRANNQTAGRGRMGRRWHSVANLSLLCSILVRPEWPPHHVHWLTMITGLSIIEAIKEQCDISLMLKWPNDIIFVQDERWYKVGGILVESTLESNNIIHAIIGIGINVNLSPAQIKMINEKIPSHHLKATSLYALNGKRVGQEKLLAALMLSLDKEMVMCNKGVCPKQRWQQLLAGMGEMVQMGDLIGTMEGVDSFGRVLINDGYVEHAQSVGDVSLRSAREQ